ncbi:MAG: hypothetical protein LKG25_05600 [Prevotella sp.]|jgi:16S rRNA C967 or C1407 C5-methylase (RsmB/RsmF family)/NOL1/NOP2/fmu family ribosome biogenesis protein|nr:hypothetical protein [Prevotella sp.]MCI1282051.1 hypothetical protein [Prevotella sp.]
MNLPAEFCEYTRHLMGEELYQTLEKGLQEEAPVSIRLNPFKCDSDKTSVPFMEGKVAWCDNGYYLRERPNFTFDPLLHAGLYYVQEASSMFLHHVLRQIVKEPVLMLDLCAAPGGKSTVAMSALPKGSILFSNEPMRTRAQILNENILKFGHPDIYVSNNYAHDYAKTRLQFDVILTDVPCSGEGMFRKDEGAIAEWSVQNVQKCTALQRQIVTDIWPCLKPGGYLIYSTCTFNAHENEENASWIATELGAEGIEISVDSSWNITEALTGNLPVCRFLPGKTRGEGLFMTVLRKPGDRSEGFQLPSQIKGLNILSHGIQADTAKGKNLIPDISKALSILPDKEQYPKVEVSYEQAISYLRKEAVNLPAGTPLGIVLLTYQGRAIGFEKNIGNRANNLYPQEWRIKSTHIPEMKQNIIEI